MEREFQDKVVFFIGGAQSISKCIANMFEEQRMKKKRKHYIIQSPYDKKASTSRFTVYFEYQASHKEKISLPSHINQFLNCQTSKQKSVLQLIVLALPAENTVLATYRCHASLPLLFSQFIHYICFN